MQFPFLRDPWGCSCSASFSCLSNTLLAQIKHGFQPLHRDLDFPQNRIILSVSPGGLCTINVRLVWGTSQIGKGYGIPECGSNYPFSTRQLSQGLRVIRVHRILEMCEGFLINVTAPWVHNFYTRKVTRTYLQYLLGRAQTLFTPCNYVATLPVASLTRPHLSSSGRTVSFKSSFEQLYDLTHLVPDWTKAKNLIVP